MTKGVVHDDVITKLWQVYSAFRFPPSFSPDLQVDVLLSQARARTFPNFNAEEPSLC